MPLRLTGTALPTGKECDLNRQCGVVNPETKKICTRLLTCKVTPPTAQTGPWAGRGWSCSPRSSSRDGGEAQTRQGEGRLPTVGLELGQQAGGGFQIPRFRGGFWPCGGVKQRHTDTPANTLTSPLSPLAQARAHRCPSPLLSSHPLPTPPSCCVLDPLGAPAPGGPGPGQGL